MGETFVRVIVGNEEKGIWRISENQQEVINALMDVGAIADNVTIDELTIRLMN